ncbi:ChbG/HpnK family deacetylase, partial [Bacillus paralicheniformis]|uniref:ChbG/HpnK family deacetylase n=2 Tax=Bacillaceae TaxID=186817 RepID=UPI00119FC9FA
MKSLIINADDFGFSRGVNLGIIEAFQHGVLTSTTLMVNMQEAEHAVELARQNRELGVGVHLTLTAGRPILGGLHMITD